MEFRAYNYVQFYPVIFIIIFPPDILSLHRIFVFLQNKPAFIMQTVRVTKIFNFEMAHALWNYDGLCSNIHGHSYILHVTVMGIPRNNPDDAKNGMLVDFGDLKEIVNNTVVKIFDHTLVLNKDSSYRNLLNSPQMLDRRHIVGYQPTCENLVCDFALRIKDALPTGVKLHSLRLYETASSYAEWFATDN